MKVLRACYSTREKNWKKDVSKLIYHKKDENVTKNFNKYKTFENWALCFEKVVQQDLFPHTVHCAILC